MVKLSRRLSAIAERILPGTYASADIGSDHALLPIFLVEQQKVKVAIAGEISDGPLAAAERGVAEAGLRERISVRKGDGLAVVMPSDKVEAVTISGMGGALIVRILEEGRGRLAGARQLVLQPNIGGELVRQWLLLHGWFLQDETIVLEDGKVYEVMNALQIAHADKRSLDLYAEDILSDGSMRITRDMKLKFGPYLLYQENEAFEQKWLDEKQKLLRIVRQIDTASNAEEVQEKRAVIMKEIREIEEVLAWRQRDKR